MSRLRAARLTRGPPKSRLPAKIEHGEISGIDVVRAYVAALGGSVDVVARLSVRSWKVA